MNAEGDGLDSNGNLFVRGGHIVVDGPSTMVFMDRVINWPTTNGRRSERAVSDIVYLSPAE